MGDVLNVRDFGAIGDGVADDTAAINAALAAALNQPSGNGINWHLNRPLYFPAGRYKVTSPIQVSNTWGCHVYGAGMYATEIFNTTPNQAVFATNGFGYSTVELMSLSAAAGGTAFDWNWTGDVAVGSQLVTFNKMIFGGSGDYGCKVGVGGLQSDTSSWIDCAFLGARQAGLFVSNLNAISHRVVGGNFQGNKVGIYVPAGAVQLISGVGFQQSTDWDILIEGGATDSYQISGISTESTNFFRCRTTAAAATLIGCAHRGGANGVFAEGAAILHVEGCQSKRGSLSAATRNLTVKNSSFWRIDALPAVPTWAGSLWRIENSLFGMDEASVARREIDTIVTPAGKRTRGIEGTSLAADSVVNAGAATCNDLGGSTTAIVTLTIASPCAVTMHDDNPHGFVAGTVVAFATTGKLPQGVSINTAYYVLASDLADTAFQISASPGGTSIVTHGTQKGVHSLYLVREFAVGDQVLNSGVAAGGSPGWICTTAGPALGTAVFAALANVAGGAH